MWTWMKYRKVITTESVGIELNREKTSGKADNEVRNRNVKKDVKA